MDAYTDCNDGTPINILYTNYMAKTVDSRSVVTVSVAMNSHYTCRVIV